MVPGVYNFKPVVTGDTWSRAGVGMRLWEDPAKTIPMNLTGATILLQIKKAATDSTAIHTLTQASGIVVTGNYLLIQPFIVTFPAGNYVYDLQITFTGGVIQTYLQGTFVVKQDVSR